jgi:hypothetical protein
MSRNEKYGPKEARARFEAALLGARVAGHKPMKSMASKRRKPRKKSK